MHMFLSPLLLEIQQSPLKRDTIVWVLNWLSGKFPLVGLLILLIFADVALGYCAASIASAVNSSASGKGMLKKVAILILVGVCSILEPLTNGIPLSGSAAFFFILYELTSIVENAGRCGLPVPPHILAALSVMKSADKIKAMLQPPPMNVTQNISAKNVSIPMAESHSTDNSSQRNSTDNRNNPEPAKKEENG